VAGIASARGCPAWRVHHELPVVHGAQHQEQDWVSVFHLGFEQVFRVTGETIVETAIDAPSREVVEHIPSAKKDDQRPVPMLSNYLFCALAGTTWYFQFFFYTMGETQMGKYGFSSWTLHMASIIIFSTLWGLGLKEWKGAGAPAMRLLSLALLLLVGSTVIVGYGNYLGLAH